jgi:hypothetical protein
MEMYLELFPDVHARLDIGSLCCEKLMPLGSWRTYSQRMKPSARQMVSKIQNASDLVSFVPHTIEGHIALIKCNCE